MILLPFFFGLIFMITNFITSKELTIYHFCLNFMISFFMLQEQIFSKLFELISCQNYKFDNSDSKSYLRNFLKIECFTESHNNWIFFIIIPSFSFYGAIIPFLITSFTQFKKKSWNMSRFI